LLGARITPADLVTVGLTAGHRTPILMMTVAALTGPAVAAGERQARRIGGQEPSPPALARVAAGLRPADDRYGVPGSALGSRRMHGSQFFAGTGRAPQSPEKRI
jgi:hypothetical protein